VEHVIYSDLGVTVTSVRVSVASASYPLGMIAEVNTPQRPPNVGPPVAVALCGVGAALVAVWQAIAATYLTVDTLVSVVGTGLAAPVLIAIGVVLYTRAKPAFGLFIRSAGGPFAELAWTPDRDRRDALAAALHNTLAARHG
jgi:hypothetical protein